MMLMGEDGGGRLGAVDRCRMVVTGSRRRLRGLPSRR